MEDSCKLGWAYSVQEIVLPFPGKEENIPSDDEQINPLIQHRMSNEDSGAQETGTFAAVNEKKRKRTRFNIFQKAELEKAFTASPYLAPIHRIALAERLNVKPVAVQSWFKNRRFKLRKEVKEGPKNPSRGLPLQIPSAEAYLPVAYQPPCVVNSGSFSLTRCQGFNTGEPKGEDFRSPFYCYATY